MRAAEKYAELEAAGLERPRCECHGEVMRWSAKDIPSGGCWRCVEKAKKYNRRWCSDNQERRSEYGRRYREKTRSARHEYNRIYYVTNREREKERSKRYREANHERSLEAMRLYRERNHDQLREYASRRVRMFGERITAPDQEFKQFAIALRDERRKHQTEARSLDG